MAAINLTNCKTTVNGMTLTELIAKKDALKVKVSNYKTFVYTVGSGADRARGTEIKIKAVIKASELQKLVDKLSKEIRLLDNRLQQTNWETDLLE